MQLKVIYKIRNKTKGITISQKAKIAKSFLSRFKGLMFRKSMDEDKALIFYHTRSIHTFFMRFPIDVVFLNKNLQVIRVCKVLKSWRVIFCSQAFAAIEFSSHTASRKSLDVGDVLEIASS